MKLSILTLKDYAKEKLFRVFLCLFFFIFVAGIPKVNATHLLGGEITYGCLGGGDYVITLTLFRDCDGIPLGPDQEVDIDGGLCFSTTLTVYRESITDVTPLCPGESSSCNGGAVRGIERHIYKAQVSLPNLPFICPTFTLSYRGCCRNDAITTIPNGEGFYISSLLDNSVSNPCNSSPVFNNDASASGCVGQVVNYNHGVTDPDGDVLVFSLVDCLEDAGDPVDYFPGYSGTTPLSTMSGVSINPMTGAITFTPNIVQVGVLCVKVEEYRGGVKIGEVTRDIQFNIESCNSGNQLPTASGPYNYNATPGVQLCFNITGSDPDAGDMVKLSTNNGIPGGTFNPTLPTGYATTQTTQFCWTPTAADQNTTQFFTITVQDDACPSPGQSTFTYAIDVASACMLAIDCPGDVTAMSDDDACGTNVTFDDPILPNGCPNATVVCTTGMSCDAGHKLKLRLRFDTYPDETSWEIVNSGGIQIASGGPYGGQAPGSVITETINGVPNGDYTFIIHDAFGDGMCCAYGNGKYKLKSQGNIIAQGGSFGFSESTDFCVGPGNQMVVHSGDFFPVGTTTVTCTATDGSQTATCTFDVTVTDDTPPILETGCPDDITRCGAQNISWTPPTASDNCGIVSAVSNYNPGDYFDVGSYTVTYTFYDDAGLSVSCSFDITVNPLPDATISQLNLGYWCQGVKGLAVKIFNYPDLTPPITFAWSNGLGSASAVTAPANGTYYVTVTDGNGCQSILSTVVNEDLSTLLSAYTIIGDKGTKMYESEVQSGGVGAIDADETRIFENTSIWTFLRADMSGVTIDGTSFVNSTIDADYSAPLPIFLSNPYYDNNNVTVAPNTTMTLSGSHYGNIIIKHGATVNIANNNIYVKYLRTENNVTINFLQPTNMRIKKKMNIGEMNVINSAFYKSVIYVSDNCSIHQGSYITVNIFAQENINVNDSGSTLTTYMTGLFISNNRVSSDYYVIWNWNLNTCNNSGIMPLSTQDDSGDDKEATGIAKEKTAGDRGLNIYPNPTSGLLNIDLGEYQGESVDINIYDPVGRVVWSKHINKVESNVIQAKLFGNQNQLYMLSVKTDKDVKTKLFALNK